MYGMILLCVEAVGSRSVHSRRSWSQSRQLRLCRCRPHDISSDRLFDTSWAQQTGDGQPQLCCLLSSYYYFCDI